MKEYGVIIVEISGYFSHEGQAHLGRLNDCFIFGFSLFILGMHNFDYEVTIPERQYLGGRADQKQEETG